MYDLIVEGGRVLDPSQGIDRAADLAIGHGRIAAMEPSLVDSGAATRIDARGLVVTPGLIDGHCHVYEGFTTLGVAPDNLGVRSGITTVVDAGSSGSATIGGLIQMIIPRALTRVFVFLNAAATGLAHTPEVRTLDDIVLNQTVDVAVRHPDTIRGIKFRTVGPGGAGPDLEAFHAAKAISHRSGIPLMVHIGDRTRTYTSDAVRSIIAQLDAGDIVTHMYSPEGASISLDDSKMMAVVIEAIERGVFFDASPGTAGLSFQKAQELIQLGVRPFTIGSDLTVRGRQDGVFSLHEVLGSFMALGLSLPDVIRMTTLNAAKVLGEEDLGTLRIGRPADVSLLKIVKGDWLFIDSVGGKISGDVAIEPVGCLARGRLVVADGAPHPWGWLPQP